MDSLFISNILVLDAKNKTKIFNALTDSDVKVNIINRVIARRMGLSILNTNIGLSVIYNETVKIYKIYYIEFQQKDK